MFVENVHVQSCGLPSTGFFPLLTEWVFFCASVLKMAFPLNFGGIMGGREKALTEKGTDDRVNVVCSTQRYLIFSNSSSRNSG